MDSSVMWSPGMSLEKLEELCIIKCYRFYGKNKTATANSLGISIRTLDNKLEKYEKEEAQNAIDANERAAHRVKELSRSRGEVPISPNIRKESVIDVTAKQSMPVQERQKVQEVLSRSPSNTSSRKFG